MHPVRRRHTKDVRAVVNRTRVLNDVLFELRVAGVCLRHTHTVLHKQLGAVRRQLLGVQLQAHKEKSADGEVERGELQRFRIIGVEEQANVELEFDADLDVVEDVLAGRNVANVVYYLVRYFVQRALYWQKVIGERRSYWASAERLDTEPRLERLPGVVFLRSID